MGSGGHRWQEGKKEGAKPEDLIKVSYLHFGAFPFDFNYLL